MTTPIETAPLEFHISVPLTRLEFVLLTYVSHMEGFDAEEWMRNLFTMAVRSKLHEQLQQDLLGRTTTEA